ncbi:O-fucosyltransferase 36-like [Phoenix dactylifera]|uniref:GDP-fucose protein O-fucosyltransferase 2 n=1 Tax=Phoenix dactylifera TaxID=42345 RepID=A0A8B7D4G2_PHODC|nr:O-fucosyltransferase 36-like [Phoenix dactylifera]
MERDRSSDSSSDEEEDRRTLVPQNEVKPWYPFSAFEIGDLPARIRRGFWTSKRYLFAICLPLVLILLFFSLDLGSLFHGVSIVRADYPGDRMRESELRALYLLRNQQLGLLKLWNQTLSAAHPGSEVSPSTPAVPSNSSNSTTSGKVVDLPRSFNSVSFEEFRSALLEQIKLNKQIQKTLLSTHRVGNTSSESSDNNVDFDLSGSGVDVCKKVERPAERRTIEWKPKKDRYLFAICLSGQMSNHLICLEKHMFFAALLGRTLVLPSSKVDYQYDRVLDIDHINKCFSRKVVITFEEFYEMKKNKMRIDRFICYIASPPCYLDEEHIKRLEKLGISLGKIEAAWPEDAKLKMQKKRVVEDIMPKFSSDDEVLAIGDMFYADVEEEWVMQPGGPLAHKCRTVIQPSRLVILTAQRFVQTFLGSNYIALHFRRHGFLKFCNVKKESCFYPIPQAAECILRVVERANAPVIYLSTDAADSETNLLQSMVVFNDKPVALVKRPDHTNAEKWDALLYRNHMGGDSQVEAMLDKTICALSNVFIGASGSTFTEDIIRLRKGWESASQCDEYLCQGELPNYIAELQ